MGRLILTLILAVLALLPGLARAQSARPLVVGRCDGPAVSRWSPLIVRAAGRHHLSPQILAGLIAVESGGNPAAVSPAGAEGLTQLLPSTAASVHVYRLLDPHQSILGGARYLRALLNYREGLYWALAAYNAGPGNAGAGWGYAAAVLRRAC